MRHTDMVIGVTGGVGTGKSTVLDLLKTEYNAAIIIADDVARDQMMPGCAVYDHIVEAFGDCILTEGAGSLIDRALLAGIVFQDGNKLKQLNALVHPAVKEDIMGRITRYQKEGVSMIVVETAILIEAGYQELVDELWVVHTDLEVRISRLALSRGYSREKTLSIIRSQLPAEEMEAQADLVIDNSRDLDHVRQQIREHLSYERTDH